MMTTILRLLKTESLKINKTIIPWVVLVPPIIYGFLMQQLFVQGGPSVLSDDMNAWESLQAKYWPGMLMLFVPIFVALINSVSHFLDNRGSIWKIVYTLPISRSLIYSVKSIFTLILVFILFLLVALIMLPVAWSVNLIVGEALFSYQLDFFLHEILPTALKAFFGSLLIWSIHNWISYRFDNYIISVILALVGAITTLIAIQGSEYTIYFPYAFPYLAVVSDASTSTQVLISSIIGSTVIFALSIVDQKYLNNNKS